MTQKTCHSTAETLIFMTMQKLRSYTKQLTRKDMPNLDYLFHTPCIMLENTEYVQTKIREDLGKN